MGCSSSEPSILNAFRIASIGVATLLAANAAAAASDQRLIDAVKAGDRQAVRRLVKTPGAMADVDVDGTTALHWAARADDVDSVRFLLQAGAKPNSANRYGMTPISLAAVNGNPQIIQLLLDAGADPNTALPRGETVLMTASRTGNDMAVRALIARGADVNAAETWQGESALMWAVAEDHPGVARALIAAGANVDARSSVSHFPKMEFSSGGLVPMELPKGGFTPLMYAARQGAMESARVLIDSGADLNATDPDGSTALVLAIINAHYELAAMLLESGADPEIADGSGMAALYAMVDMHTLGWMQGRPAPKPTGSMAATDVLRMLLDYGANVNAPLKSPLLLRHHALGDPVLGAGATPIMRAAKTDDLVGARLLLEHGADLTHKQQNGTTALMVAAGLGWRDGGGALPVYDRGSEGDAIEFIKLCLERGVDINAANDAGDTALHGAAVRGADSIIRFLVRQGARVNTANKQGRTPLDIALRREDRSPSTVAVLRELAGGAPEASRR